MRDYAQTRIVYCPVCLQDGIVKRALPCPKYEKESFPSLVYRCSYCDNVIMPEELIGMDQLLQALLDTITIHKAPEELMERLEIRRYGDPYKRERS